MDKEVIHTVERLFISLPVILYLVLIIVLAYITQSPVFAVFVGLFATLLHLIVLIVLTAYRLNHHWSIWVVPLVLTGLFVLVAQESGLAIFEQLEVGMVATLNVGFSFLLNLLFYNPKYVTGVDTSELDRLREEVEHYKQKLTVTKDNLQTSLRGIEDKCKAYNFVIGRVYSDKKGGSAQIREKINIPRELYNRFSELSEDLDNPKELRSVIEQILQKLVLAEKEEGDVFSISEGKLPLERKSGDSVLDVLVRNDKDPVQDYHSEAKEICQQILKLLDEENVGRKV